jgi:hypothetical protein
MNDMRLNWKTYEKLGDEIYKLSDFWLYGNNIDDVEAIENFPFYRPHAVHNINDIFKYCEILFKSPFVDGWLEATVISMDIEEQFAIAENEYGKQYALYFNNTDGWMSMGPFVNVDALKKINAI